MIEKLPESSGNVIGFRIRGKLTEADYLDLLVPEDGEGHEGVPQDQGRLGHGGLQGLDGRRGMGGFPSRTKVFGSREDGDSHR